MAIRPYVFMTLFHSILLGIVQGFGEFLPISSSAHLIITPWLFNFADPGLTFDVALHFGTLLALILYFWRDWVEIIRGFLRASLSNPPVSPCDNPPSLFPPLFKGGIKGGLLSWGDTRLPPLNLRGGGGELPNYFEQDRYHQKLFWQLALASIPGALAGFFLEKFAENILRHPLLIAWDMALLGFVLLLADRKGSAGKDMGGVSFRDSLLIGISQAFALIPGVSRSGVTMTAGLFLGLSRVTSARFSFLMAAPITFGACLLKTKHFFQEGVGVNEITGIVVSGIVGLLSIKYLLKYIQSYGYRVFVYYRFGFAALVAVIFFLRS